MNAEVEPDLDPPIPPEADAAHRSACARGERGYWDPATGLFVMTELALRERGHCCGNGCRHCPYDEAEQRAAGRPRLPRPRR